MPSKRKEKKLIRSLDTVGFYSDFDKPGTIFAALVRSPSPVGKIKSITISDLPEGYYFFTEKDIPGAKSIKINKTVIKVFENKNISYTGEPLGIIAGPDETTVLSLLDNISVNLDVENLESALKNVIKNNIITEKTEKKFANNDDDEKINEKNNSDVENHGENHIENPVENSGKTPNQTQNQNQNENENQSESQNQNQNEILNYNRKQNEIQNQNDEKNESFNEFVEQINEMPSLDTVIDKTKVEENPNITIATREVKYGFYKDYSIQMEENKDSEHPFESQFFENQDLIFFDDTWTQEISSQNWQQNEGVFCYMEGSSIHIYVPTKWTYLTQKSVAEVLGINFENVFIHKTKTSGVYPTGLWKTTQIALQAATVCYITRKPVKLVLSKQEQNLYMKPGVTTKFDYKVAVKPDGHIFAMKILIDIDVGSDNPFAQEITDRITLASCNYYKTENLYIYTKTHTSRMPPTTISIKVADSQSFFAIENEIQTISNRINILPDEIRLLNANIQEKNKIEKKSAKKQKNDEDEKIKFPFDIQVGNVSDVLSSVIKKSDFNRKYASFSMEAKARLENNSQAFFALPLRGIGLASGYVVSGYNGNSVFDYYSKIEITLTTEDKLIIHCIKPSDEIQKIWKKTAAEILQIPEEDIIINSEFQIDQLPENPEDTISSLGIMNELIRKCCLDIQKKRFHQPLPISAKRSVPRTSKAKWNKEDFCGTPYLATSFASTVVEVELDTYNYNEKIKGIWVTIDCGELYDQEAALRTIKLEIQQELSMLVKGKTVSCNQINISFVKSNNKSGQIGALIHNTLPAAFSSALSLALATQLNELPCTEDLLFNLIKNRTKTENSDNTKFE